MPAPNGLQTGLEAGLTHRWNQAHRVAWKSHFSQDHTDNQDPLENLVPSSQVANLDVATSQMALLKSSPFLIYLGGGREQHHILVAKGPQPLLYV